MKISKIAKQITRVVTITLPGLVYAAGDMGLSTVNQYDPPARCLPCTIMMIINYVLAIVGVVALAYIVYGGFLYITSNGDSSQVDKAKNIVIYAVIGIVVIGVAAALVNFVVGAVVQS